MRPASPSPLLSSPATDGTVANRLLPQPLPSKSPDNGVKEIAKFQFAIFLRIFLNINRASREPRKRNNSPFDHSHGIEFGTVRLINGDGDFTRVS